VVAKLQDLFDCRAPVNVRSLHEVMAYTFNEGNLVVPDDWRDESMNIFKAPVDAGYNLVMSRERIPRSIDPGMHLEAQRKVIEENLMGFHEHERRSLALDGQTCVWLDYSWQSPEGPMHQINVMRVVGDTLLSFTFTSARRITAAQRDLFRTILESYSEPRRAA